MRKNFNYSYEETSTADIQIEDVGNVVLKAINLQQQCWILYIKTVLGFTSILQYGPYSLDGIRQQYCQATYSRFEYSEYKLSKIIDNFINNPRYMITQVIEIDEYEARDDIQPMLEVFDESYQ